MQNLKLAVRVYCALVESKQEITSGTLWSHDETLKAIKESSWNGTADVLLEMDEISRDRIFKYVYEMAPFSTKGADVFVFEDEGKAAEFAGVMLERDAQVDVLAANVVSVLGEDDAFVASKAIELGGSLYSGPELADQFEWVDRDLLHDLIISEGMPLTDVAAVLSSRIDGKLTESSMRPFKKYAERIEHFFRPRKRVFGVDSRLVEGAVRAGLIPESVVGAITESAPWMSSLVEVASADADQGPTPAVTTGAGVSTQTRGVPDDRGGVAKGRSDTSGGSPATSKVGVQKKQSPPTEHVPTEEEGGVDGSIKLSDGTVVPKDVLQKAAAKILHNIATQMETGTTGGKPEEREDDKSVKGKPEPEAPSVPNPKPEEEGQGGEEKVPPEEPPENPKPSYRRESFSQHALDALMEGQDLDDIMRESDSELYVDMLGDSLREAAQMSPDATVIDSVNGAIEYFNAGDFRGALECLESAITSARNDGRTSHFLNQAYDFAIRCMEACGGTHKQLLLGKKKSGMSSREKAAIAAKFAKQRRDSYPEDDFDEGCKTPGMRKRAPYGKGRGAARGDGEGPRGVPVDFEPDEEEPEDDVEEQKLGTGARFTKLANKLTARGNVRDPKAVAAAIGREKYGDKKFQQLAAKGRRDARDVGSSDESYATSVGGHKASEYGGKGGFGRIHYQGKTYPSHAALQRALQKGMEAPTPEYELHMRKGRSKNESVDNHPAGLNTEHVDKIGDDGDALDLLYGKPASSKTVELGFGKQGRSMAIDFIKELPLEYQFEARIRRDIDGQGDIYVVLESDKQTYSKSDIAFINGFANRFGGKIRTPDRIRSEFPTRSPRMVGESVSGFAAIEDMVRIGRKAAFDLKTSGLPLIESRLSSVRSKTAPTAMSAASSAVADIVENYRALASALSELQGSLEEAGITLVEQKSEPETVQTSAFEDGEERTIREALRRCVPTSIPERISEGFSSGEMLDAISVRCRDLYLTRPQLWEVYHTLRKTSFIIEARMYDLGICESDAALLREVGSRLVEGVSDLGRCKVTQSQVSEAVSLLRKCGMDAHAKLADALESAMQTAVASETVGSNL